VFSLLGMGSKILTWIQKIFRGFGFGVLTGSIDSGKRRLRV
jgi:hypothetical protein